MKKIIALAIIALMLVSCGLPKPDKTYDHQYFSFMYPDGWKVITSDAGADLINEEAKANIAIRYILDSNSKANQTASISGLVTTITQTLKGKVTTQTEFSAGNFNGVWIVTTQETSVNYIIPCDGIAYQLSLSPGDFNGNLVDQIQEIAKTFIPKVTKVETNQKDQTTPANGSTDTTTTDPVVEKQDPKPNNTIDDEKFEGEIKVSDNYVYVMPKSWKVDGDTLSEISTYLIPLDSAASDTSISIQFQPQNYGNIDEVASRLATALGGENTKVEKLTIGDAQARRFEATDGKVTTIQTIIITKGKFANIVYSQVKHDLKADYFNLVKSFRFK